LVCARNVLSATVDVLFASAAHNVDTQKQIALQAAGITDYASNVTWVIFCDEDMRDMAQTIENERTMGELKRKAQPYWGAFE